MWVDGFKEETMTRYPVVNAWRPTLGQQKPVNYITTEDFAAYVTQAKSSLKMVADIARSYDLSDEDLRAIELEVGKVGGFTIPMAEVPKSDDGPSWLMVGGALLAGGLIGSML
jgi:hypothetical protein